MTNVPPGGGFPPPPSGPPPGGFPPPPSGGGGFPPPGGGGGFPPPGGGFGAPGGGPPGLPGPLAEWQDRLLSGVIDFFGLWFVGWLLATIGNGFSFGYANDAGALWLLGTLLQVVAVGWALFNGYQAGQTGQSIGMKQSGLRLVGEQTGQPIGGQQGLVRNLLFVVTGCCCAPVGLVDNLFPLWDSKKQTLRDKIGKSVVVKAG
ncbi:RDD family protein [Iamia sp. SCSIO 61187]|uniref:RDD family protein n=1 Tax=Iamia sp. SCSIO 61187 TaxID=2722752 RepID=UPI001C63A3F1|nr:RDD family protein [Iamia sp. SCSIO 61187]QYG93028.1 RDD family protein [Iamia sp. SCSIO 61187]